MSPFRIGLPCLVFLAACPSPRPTPEPGAPSSGDPPQGDAAAAPPRYAAPPPPLRDAALAAEVSAADAAAAPAPDAAIEARAEPPPTPARFPARGCLPPGDPRIARLQTEAAAATRKAFEAALRRRGLAPAGISPVQKTLHRGIGGYGNQRRGAARGTVVTENGRRFVAGDAYWTGNARAPQPWEMVKNKRGEVFHLLRRPHPSAASKTVVVCGCAPRTCGPYGSGCPACGATIQSMYELPRGSRYAGELALPYPETTALVQRQGGTCQPVRPCPGPPP